MSYISDALRKARKVKSKDEEQVKRSIWSSLSGAAPAKGKKNDTWQKWYTVIGLSIALLYAVGIIVVMYWSDIKPKLISAPRGPVRVTVDPITVPKAQNPPQQVQEAQAPKTAVLPEAGAPPAVDVNMPKAPVAAAGAEVKEVPKTELPGDVEPEPPVKKISGDPKRLYARALEKQREGKLEEAKDLYREVIRQQPRNIKALNNLGVVYMKMKRYNWAVIRLNEAVKIKPDYVDAHYNLACLHAQLNNKSKSLYYLKNAIELNPDAKTWAAQDGDFKGLANLAEYKDIIRAQDN